MQHLYFRYLHLAILLLWVIIVVKTASSQQALPNCQDKCGNISIPYPFGTTEACYRDRFFLVTCNESFNPPKAFFGKGNVRLTDISLREGEVRSSVFVASNCYDANGKGDGSYYSEFNLTKIYTFSDKRNKFTVVGCDSYAYIQGKGNSYNSGCTSLCNDIDSITNYSCSGIGCCQTAIPKGLKNYVVTAYSFYNHTKVWNFNPCTCAFLVEEKSYNFSTLDLRDLEGTSVPVVFDWVIDNITCQQAEKNLTSFACKQNSYCFDSDNGVGYRCNCTEGFDGNPYLEDGCIDVNECEGSNDCTHLCHNLIGSYNCSCRPGYAGDGRKSGHGCTLTLINYYNEKPLIIKVTVGIGVPIFVLVVIGLWLYWRMRERNLKLKEKHFEQNGGLLLQKMLGGSSSPDETAKLFTMEELKKATNGFDDKKIIGKGGFGIVYKGVLPKNKIVAIKKSKVADQIHEQFANEFIVLSNINHPNVVKLLGCCLETQVPLLVYEFIANGTLSRHIHNGGHVSLPWETRLRVASETAGALAHLHSAASPPIIHGDVKPCNILLDENFTAKVSDFGDSRLIPVGEAQLDTLVKGTIGYLDPEYLQTSQLTEKSDVYSFGVVLVELLTGKGAISSDNTGEKRYSVQYFISSLKQNRLFQILDARVANEGSIEQIREVAKIAESCLRLNGEDRPIMKDVAMELEGLRKVEQHLFIQFELNFEETKRLVSESMDFCSTSASIEFDSLKNQGISPFEVDCGR